MQKCLFIIFKRKESYRHVARSALIAMETLKSLKTIDKNKFINFKLIVMIT